MKEQRAPQEKKGRHDRITGIVQGVGFRPFVYQLATQSHLTGKVWNTSEGVEIKLFGLPENFQRFDQLFSANLPPLAKVDSYNMMEIPFCAAALFEIVESQPTVGDFLPISPDIAICDDCRRELFENNNRHSHYALNNCTNCGPRFTIIKNIPYDRPNTTMADFPMCSACAKEYHDPLDRRFHAQPVACSQCGPILSFWAFDAPFSILCSDEALSAAAQMLNMGGILAVKGIGGYHLACSAKNDDAVNRLRAIKRRSLKPFALMARELSTVEKFVHCSECEKALLTSPQAPIVVLQKNSMCDLPNQIAPMQNQLGFMLPYTPLHVLIFSFLPDDCDVLVMTSANHSEEPIVYRDGADDIAALSKLADGILTHNRPIETRVDDSVIRFFDDVNSPILLRRSRGYAPAPIKLAAPALPILTTGAMLKNAFCLTHGDYAFVSHHIGDMENAETYESFVEGILHYQKLFRTEPKAFCSDLHPDFYSTRYAESRSADERKPLLKIQHHHAHIASVLGEHGIFPVPPETPAIGLAFDGTGYGIDKTIWGGEAFLVSGNAFQRCGSFSPFPLPGGDTAIRFPWRQTYALLNQYGLPMDPWLHSVPDIEPDALLALKYQLKNQINCVMTSSLGRIFDAASSLLGICHQVNYEGQAAIEMEHLADMQCVDPYPIEFSDVQIELEPIFRSIIKDQMRGVSVEKIAGKFHHTMIQCALVFCSRIRNEHDERANLVALSGGVWQNEILLSGVKTGLEKQGYVVLLPIDLPFNDGCISFGQAMIGNAHWKGMDYVLGCAGKN